MGRVLQMSKQEISVQCKAATHEEEDLDEAEWVEWAFICLG